MNLNDLISRVPQPLPWSEGDNIPWHDPAFSQRMLNEHLSQDHDWASRRTEKIAAQVAWIHEYALTARPGRVLDLGCGPGLYLSRLAQLGHIGSGIDYSPASIQYALQAAQSEASSTQYHCADLREADFGEDFDAVLFLFGEMNVFSPGDIRRILSKAYAALRPGGVLVLEPHTYEAVQAIGQSSSTWYTQDAGLFSDQPHLVLEEHVWDPQENTATCRYYIVDAASAEVTRYAQSFQAYTARQYGSLLTLLGFRDITIYPSLGGIHTNGDQDLLGITAYK
ncbi:class I SAM-dependent methyltransferase [Levilinea saccharolytica]|uniref:class I SAM-dependent methyltransferase n=1 Tax=Levilinea saccharolytica TaxID=229921 RepID=UPI000785E009|nr:class I SAM-dependent methyltransferase [Levilinea saccharolytica]GAP18467.1 protein containing methyltransferase domain [Levilinea saccharolytica]